MTYTSFGGGGMCVIEKSDWPNCVGTIICGDATNCCCWYDRFGECDKSCVDADRDIGSI
jgi:hypothetical protein